MAVHCLDQCRDDATSVRPYISWPFEHSLHPFRSHESPKPQITQEPSNNEKPKKHRFDEYFLSKCIRRHRHRSKFTPLNKTKRSKWALGERVERSRDSLKKKIRASEDMASHLGKRIRKCFVKIATKLPYLCGKKRSM